MTHNAKRPRKKILTPKPGSKFYDEVMNEREQKALISSPSGRPLIREVSPNPQPRTIQFFGDIISFTPYAGKYWVLKSCMSNCIKCDVDPHDTLKEDYPEMYDAPPSGAVNVFGRKMRLHGHWSDRTAEFYALGQMQTRKGRHILPRLPHFINLLRALRGSLLIHSHTMIGESERLREVLNRNPLWEPIQTLWNEGQSEGEIAYTLSCSVTKVRSAILNMPAHGFELISSADKQAQRVSHGRAILIPSVGTGGC